MSLLEASKRQKITLQAYGQQWLATDVALVGYHKVNARRRGKLMEGMKPHMARIMLMVLRACLYAAVEEGRLTGHPVARVGKFVGRARVEVDIFTRVAGMLRIVKGGGV
jgi:hypothetical protein